MYIHKQTCYNQNDCVYKERPPPLECYTHSCGGRLPIYVTVPVKNYHIYFKFP